MAMGFRVTELDRPPEEFMAGAAQTEPAVARDVTGGELGRMTSSRMITAPGSRSAMSRSAQLVIEHDRSVRTSRTRGSKLKNWLAFCATDVP